MSAAPELHVGDIGTTIRLSIVEGGVAVDLSSATLLEIHARKPGGTVVEWTAAKYGSSTVEYVTQEGDLDVAGTWFFQAYIETPSWKGHAAKLRVTVLPVICAS